MTSAVSPRPVALAVFQRAPEALQERLERAVLLYKSGAVSVGPDCLWVLSSTGRGRYRVSFDLSRCTCPDSHRGQICKHCLCAGLYLAAREVAQKKLPTLMRLVRAYLKGALHAA